MLKLKKQNVVPPGGYRFKVESTGFTITGSDFNSLCDKVVEHFVANNMVYTLPEGISLRDVIEDQICQNIPRILSHDPKQKRYVHFVQTGVPSIARVAPRLGSAHLDRTMALIQIAKRTEHPFVEQELAEIRALRAQQCPYVRSSKVCYVCHHEGPVMQCFGEKKQTSLDNRLHVCGKLGVYMQAAVHISADVLRSLFTESDKTGLDPAFWFFPEL